MRWPDPYAGPALRLLADKWMVPILRELSSGPKRYTQLQRAIPQVTASMLTRTLQRMERNGFVQRRQFPGIPPIVEYRLTPLGETLRQPLGVLAAWARQHARRVLGFPEGDTDLGSAG